ILKQFQIGTTSKVSELCIEKIDTYKNNIVVVNVFTSWYLYKKGGIYMTKIVLSLLIGSTLGSAIIQPTVMVYASVV
ncbi:MAG: hypothetical protein WAZ42_08545, partial [Trichococcus flocculiformis]